MAEDREALKRRLMHLRQVKKMSPEEADEYVESIIENRTKSQFYEKRIKDKLAEFEQDYDLSSLKANDKLVLRALIQSLINLEDYEQIAYKIQQKVFNGTDTPEDIQKLEKLNKLMDTLRLSISRFQDDLKISRRIRQSDEESSLVDYISHLKDRAKKFYESKHLRIFCPKCNTLLFTGWFLYNDSSKNSVRVFCKRCQEDFLIKAKEVYENGMTNYKDVPEF